jgi:hypothetical protein
MKTVQLFVTCDGQQFVSKEDARKHEVQVEALNHLRLILKSAIDSSMTRQGNIDNVLKNILEEHNTIRGILLSYCKKTPRTKASA